MSRALILVAALAALVVGSTAASPSEYTIRSDYRIGAFRTKVPDASLATATRVFGPPSRVRRRTAVSCVAVWRDRGLTMSLLDLARRNPCRDGRFVSATMIGRAWHTSLGLRVGDPVARIRRLFPHAGLHRRAGPDTGWWLVTRHTCAEVGGQAVPGLLARTQRRRVAALVITLPVCD